MKVNTLAQEQRKVQEALDALTKKPIKMTTLERIRLLIQAHEHVVKDLPQPLQYGLGLKYVLNHISLPIAEDDLILGRISEEVPDEAGEAYYQDVLKKYGRSLPPWVYDQGHISMYWEGVTRLGLWGLKKRAEEEWSRRMDDKAPRAELDFLQGAIYVYEGLMEYLLRYAQAADALGMTEQAEACRCAATRPPQTFREALQMLWAIMLVYCSVLAANPTLTYGRMDRNLWPLYKKDIEEGRLTREEARQLVLDFYCKNNLNMGRGEHQMGGADATLATGWWRNLNFDAPQYMDLGGTDPDTGELDCTELTRIFAECIVPKFKNPVIVFRYAPGTMQKYPLLWNTLTRRMRDSASMMVYHEKDVIQAYIRAGADPEDAARAEHYGCNWPCLPGLDSSFTHHFFAWGHLENEEEKQQMQKAQTAGCDILKILMDTLHQLAEEQETLDSMEPLHAGMCERFRQGMEEKLEAGRFLRKLMLREAPGALTMQDCLFRDTISKARSAYCGGSKYYEVTFSFNGLATLIDSLAAVDELVVQKKQLTLRQLLTALEDNFQHYPRELALCKGAPKLGSDHPLANETGRRVLTELTDVIEEVQKQIDPEDYPRMLIWRTIQTDTNHIYFGKGLGATPDGRLAGVPISQNCQPTEGSSVNGLSARLMSMASLPFDRIMSGAQNIAIQPKAFAGEEGLSKLAALLGTYFEMGGLQVQISAVDVEDLKAAQVCPDQYRDLMVRITGYSAVFTDMTRMGQDEIIRREEMQK